MSDNKRRLSINEQEISLLKEAFADNESVLIAVRDLFFGLPVSQGDRKIIHTVFQDERLRDALRKKIYPRLESGTTIGETMDFWIGVEQSITGKCAEEIAQIVGYKQLALEMLERAMNLLENPDGKGNDLTFKPSKIKDDPYHTFLLARNQYIRSIETAFSLIKTIAGTKQETSEEAKKRLEKDSAK